MIYDKIISSKNYHLLEEIETTPKFSNKFISIFSINKNFTKYILKNDYNIDFLATFLKSKDEVVDRLGYLIQKEFNNTSFLYQNQNYINYFLISAYFAKDSFEAVEIFNKLQHRVAIDELSSFLVILDELNNSYNIDEILDLFDKLGEKRVYDILKFPAYISYFLPPKELKEPLVLKNLQESLIYIYDILKNQYKKDEIALLTISSIYPYLLENIQCKEFNLILFKSFFKNLVTSRLIENFYVNDICYNIERYHLFSKLNQAIKFNTRYENSFELMKKLSYYKMGIKEYFYISNEYFIFDKKNREVFMDLIFNLNDDIIISTNFVKLLRKKTNYFNLLNKYKDYDKFVIKNSYDIMGISGKKYIFILKTSYPEDNNNSLIENFYNKSLKDGFLNIAIDDLLSKSVDELQAHNFTNYELITSVIDKIEDSLMAFEIVGALVTAPQTIGASLGLVGAFSKKLFAKKIFKRVIFKVNNNKQNFSKQKFDKIDVLQSGVFSVQIGYELLKNYPFPIFETSKIYNGEICK